MNGKGHEEKENTNGTYVMNAIYIVLFLLGYIYMFYELSQRWGVH